MDGPNSRPSLQSLELYAIHALGRRIHAVGLVNVGAVDERWDGVSHPSIGAFSIPHWLPTEIAVLALGGIVGVRQCGAVLAAQALGLA